jgi:hypothetical protein
MYAAFPQRGEVPQPVFVFVVETVGVSLTVELARPVTTVSLWGRRAEVHTIRCHADEPRTAVAAIKKLLPIDG